MSTTRLVKNSLEKAKRAKKEYIINDVLLFINDPLPEEVDVGNLKRKIEASLPKRLFNNLDYIYIGDFPELKLRDVQSVYMRGAIYITNENQTEHSLFEAIIHELGHSIETTYRNSLYEDNEIAAEFVGKRKKLREILKAQGYELEDPSIFIRPEYNVDFDKFLYQTVGYDLLNQLCVGVFISPYGATSLREYFANGFEHYYLGDSEYLQKISPKLFAKIKVLTRK